MPVTQITGGLIDDFSIQRSDIDTQTPGQSVITQVIPGTGITIVSSGIDIGTGAVQISINPEYNSDKNYSFNQDFPTYLWTINHNMNKFPSVTIFDSTEDFVQIYGDIKHINQNLLIIEFSVPFSGRVILN